VTVTLTAMHERLRRDTAKLLGYDYANLTAAQSVRVERAAMLRLELDDCATKKLAGQPFDTVKYIAASEALERLIGSDPEIRGAERALASRNRMTSSNMRLGNFRLVALKTRSS
jgi:hypothetical protein